MTERPPPMFIADSIGLDFLNSTATPVDTPVEWLASGDDLLSWLERGHLIPREVAASFRRKTSRAELDAVAAQARALREWFRHFVDKHRGKPLKSDALEELGPLNRVLERESEFGRVVRRERGEGPGVKWQITRRWLSPEALLLPIARAIADVVCNADFQYIKACQGPTCTLFFLDVTHARVRRWCSMAVCGNRAKQSAHRRRAR